MKIRIITLILAIVGTGTIHADDSVLQRHALVKIATGCMRANPSHASELVSQAVMGTPLSILDKIDGWYLVETPEGYSGYMIGSSLQPMDSVQFNQWKESPRRMYTGHYTARIQSVDNKSGIVSDIHPGSILSVSGNLDGDRIAVSLPDGRKGILSASSMIPLEKLDSSVLNTDSIIAMAHNLMGVSYLWGGTTTAAMDCSGLAKICYLNQGVILQRDASQQARTGLQLDTDWSQYQRGDLIFFKSATTGNIVHVGIYDHDGLYVHSSGRVKVNSLNPESPLYIPSNILAGASRINGYLNTNGISVIADNPSFF